MGLNIRPDFATAEKHAIAGIGPLDRIAQLGDEFHLGQVVVEALCGFWPVEIGIGLLADHPAASFFFAKLRQIPVVAPVVFNALDTMGGRGDSADGVIGDGQAPVEAAPAGAPTCPSCGRALTPELLVCPRCGASLG